MSLSNKLAAEQCYDAHAAAFFALTVLTGAKSETVGLLLTDEPDFEQISSTALAEAMKDETKNNLQLWIGLHSVSIAARNVVMARTKQALRAVC